MKKIGRYELQGEIGRGGMATVYRALDPNSNREVAIKLLPREMTHSPEFRERFKQELKTISSLEHVSILPVYDSGESKGQPFFVMRYMTGGSLKDKLKNGPLPLQETALIIEKIALGLAYAHKRGIIHRDIKPDNILFDASDEPYLSDFGVAKLIASAQSSSIPSSTGSRIVGTPAYLSPEQAVGENTKVDHRSDIYGLGVLTFEMLTGEQPYKADTPMKVAVKHIKDPIPSIRELNPNLPPSLETIIQTSMAKSKEDRYSSVLEFSRALSVAAFGKERTLPAALVLERKQITELARTRKGWLIAGALSLIVLIAGYFSLPFLTPAPVPTATPTGTATVLPSSTPSIVPPSATPSSTAAIAIQIPVASPTPLGGAKQVALLRGNNIVEMNLDGSNPVTLDNRNIDKSSLQWTPDGRLFYISPIHRCAYMIDTSSKEIICFKENLRAFRVSPDGTRVAISLDNTLYIVPFEYPFKRESWKGAAITKDHLLGMDKVCRYTSSIKDVHWSQDGSRLAALVVDPGQNNSEQIHVFNVDPTGCSSRASLSLVAIDRFPANTSGLGDFDPKNTKTIPSFDWDGDHQFLLNDSFRNGVFGYLYLYDSNKKEGTKLEPLGPCCYADARWSPDKNYVLFLYQGQFESEIRLYYVPAADLHVTGESTPVDTPPGILQPRERAYPALKPAQ